jgi:hypothetical protein
MSITGLSQAIGGEIFVALLLSNRSSMSYRFRKSETRCMGMCLIVTMATIF